LSLIGTQSGNKVILRDPSILELHVRSPSDVDQRRRVLSEWYRRKLKERIPSLIAKWQPVIGVSVNDWGVKRMKTRWGSCNISAGRIWVSLELAKKPEPCLQYIIVHEMVHLLERRHGKRFKAFMDRFLPQWRAIDELLTQ
jgi:predicted metal-dependent hydrolase